MNGISHYEIVECSYSIVHVEPLFSRSSMFFTFELVLFRLVFFILILILVFIFIFVLILILIFIILLVLVVLVGPGLITLT